MPNYVFLNTKTKKEIELNMSMEDHEIFTKDNPHMVQQFNSVNIADPVRIGVQKPPADFQKYVLGKVKAGQPGANKAVIEKRWEIAREI